MKKERKGKKERERERDQRWMDGWMFTDESLQGCLYIYEKEADGVGGRRYM